MTYSLGDWRDCEGMERLKARVPCEKLVTRWLATLPDVSDPEATFGAANLASNIGPGPAEVLPRTLGQGWLMGRSPQGWQPILRQRVGVAG